MVDAVASVHLLPVLSYGHRVPRNNKIVEQE